MNINEEVKNTSKDFLSKIMPEDIFQDFVTDETLDTILETEDIKKLFEDYAESNEMSSKEACKFFLPGVELGINIGYRYGLVALGKMIAIKANDMF